MAWFTKRRFPPSRRECGEGDVLASTYPLLDAFWTILMFVAFFVWFYILFVVLVDLFRSHDLSGWVKALWFIFILILPVLGLLVYLIARGGKMHEHQVQDVTAQQQALDRYVKETASAPSSADELAKLADLRASGAITEEEFDRAKAKILA
jgi:Short C-terminal domain/Phospholipase_D-nuclease N-terminal